MGSRSPLAFLSYAHSDDAYESGRIREFANRLSGAVRLYSGDEFPIFVDRDMKWGVAWNDEIDKSLDTVVFLLPILTPAWFKSEYCRKELQRFVDREASLGRTDLILPVYWVKCPVLELDAKRAADPLAQIIHKRQWRDWSGLRHEPWTSPTVGRTFDQLASDIVEALERAAPKIVPAVVQAPQAMAAQAGATAQTVSAPSAGTRSASLDPPTVVVDAMYRGKYTNLQEAVQKEPAGTRILVRPGTYRGGLVLDKPLEIIGDGPREEIIVEAVGSHVIAFQTSMGRVANLTLRQRGGGKWYCVDIAQGRLYLEDCDISSESVSCVAIHDAAEPRVLRNRIHDGKSSGVFIFDNGAGTIDDNDIFANALSGIEISTGANPTVRRNRIHDGSAGGVFICENGSGTIEDNDIFANAASGIEIASGANPTVRRNRIHDGKVSGVFIAENGAGQIEDNDIDNNAYSGIAVREAGNPTVKSNRIRGNREGIRVYQGGRGTYLNNTLSKNKTGAWDIAKDCEPLITRTGNVEQ